MWTGDVKDGNRQGGNGYCNEEEALLLCKWEGLGVGVGMGGWGLHFVTPIKRR